MDTRRFLQSIVFYIADVSVSVSDKKHRYIRHRRRYHAAVKIQRCVRGYFRAMQQSLMAERARVTHIYLRKWAVAVLAACSVYRLVCRVHRSRRGAQNQPPSFRRIMLTVFFEQGTRMREMYALKIASAAASNVLLGTSSAATRRRQQLQERDRAALKIQRIVRGHLARLRAAVIWKLRKKWNVLIRALTRHAVKYKFKKERKQTAAMTTIQRCVRGFIVRSYLLKRIKATHLIVQGYER